MLLLYSPGKSNSMYVVISSPSILTPNFCKSPLNNYISVIQYSKLLVASSISLFTTLLCIIILVSTLVGCNFFSGLFHSHKALTLGKSSVAYSQNIYKIRPLYVLFFICWIMMSSLVLSYVLSTGFFMVPLRMI